ncbi:MAG TPA: LppX_LprAFG lipoprotein [Nocardioides sp.]|nr:LppX_LprAFG lipoprotein [Nocardioides sp.]
MTSLLVPLLLAASACSGSESEEPEETASDRLAVAKTVLDETPGLTLSIAADRLPPGITGLSSGEGVATHDPAFEGTLQVTGSGVSAEVAVVAVDGVVFAQLPFRQDFVEIEPADYGAPDPAELMSTEGGLSSLLTAAEKVEEGEQTRAGETVLTTYTGTVPGDAVGALLPSADPAGRFDAVFSIDDEDRLTRVELTGPFYPDVEDLTYVVELSDYGTEKEIVAP